MAEANTAVATTDPNGDGATRDRAAITPMEMLQIAVEKGAELDKLDKLMDLHRRWQEDEAKKAYVAALSAFKADPPKIVKNRHVGFTSRRTNESTDYDHATLDEVCNKLGPALSTHGLSFSWATDQNEHGITVTCTLTHRDGHGERVRLTAPPDTSGSKNPIQAIGSTVTYLQRYTLLAITGLSTEGQDDDAGSGAPALICDEDKNTLSWMLAEIADASDNPEQVRAAFYAWLKVESLDQIPQAQFEFVRDTLDRKRAKLRERNEDDEQEVF